VVRDGDGLILKEGRGREGEKGIIVTKGSKDFSREG